MTILLGINYIHYQTYFNTLYFSFGVSLLILNLLIVKHLLKEAFRNQKFIITDDYIVFPESFNYKLFFRLKRNFDDIAKVVIGSLLPDRQNKIYDIELEGSNKNNLVLIYFKSGGKVAINLEHLNKNERTSFIAIFNRFFEYSRANLKSLPLADNLKKNTLTNPKDLSFTDLWQSQMDNYFTSTNYLPLENNTYLLNKRYKVLKPLSIRPYNCIYLGSNQAYENIVIKEFFLDYNNEKMDKLIELFDRQIIILMNLNHPQIVKILDTFNENNRQYLILEYKEGKTLSYLVKENFKFNYSLILDIALQIVMILEYLHSQDPPVIHRDITPDNILMDENNKCYLIDFGSANHYIADLTGTIIGKQGYMPLEQIKGKANTQSDIYSLGASLYYLLTNREPVALEMSSPKRFKRDIPDDLNKLIEDATCIDLTKRIASSSDFKARILALQEKLK